MARKLPFGNMDPRTNWGLGQYQTKPETETRPEPARKTFLWPFGKNKKPPLPILEPETVPVETRKNGNGSKPPEENPT